MVVLGIDPGSRVTGFAAISKKSNRFQLLEAGCIKTQTSESIPLRLLTIRTGLVEVIERISPSEAAIESIFTYKSAESALRLGQARGVALVTLAEKGLKVTDYNPMVVKKNIAGNGRAGKSEMQRIVARLLGLEKPLTSDAADAAAIAMTHLLHSTFYSRIKKQ
ncbi:MAG: crossover junction endodeoxyribonuclease RuvC [Proteobacteria bacterium]|nr:crossover junction endodeoxyribonuclease RuvC [Pseudomonadota bacterium]